jgi:hypothetical protein
MRCCKYIVIIVLVAYDTVVDEPNFDTGVGLSVGVDPEFKRFLALHSILKRIRKSIRRFRSLRR